MQMPEVLQSQFLQKSYFNLTDHTTFQTGQQNEHRHLRCTASSWLLKIFASIFICALQQQNALEQAYFRIFYFDKFVPSLLFKRIFHTEYML